MSLYTPGVVLVQLASPRWARVAALIHPKRDFVVCRVRLPRGRAPGFKGCDGATGDCPAALPDSSEERGDKLTTERPRNPRGCTLKVGF